MNNENKSIIKAIDMFGRVPEQWELLEEIERLNNIIDKKEQFLGDNIKRLEREVVKRDNIINELEKWLENKDKNALQDDNYCEVLDKLRELKGSGSNGN